jgi:membrane protein YqaA with SNARE-associated domain
VSFLTNEAVQAWMASPYALAILGLLSFSESAFFIIPPEVMVIPMSLTAPHLSLWLGAFITVLSVAGAAFGYWLGKVGGRPILNKLFKPDHVAAVQKLFHKYDAKAIFIAAFTPIPFKVFTISAGVFDLNLQRFLLASLLGRGTRYMLIAGAIAAFGESIAWFLENQFDMAILIGTILLLVIWAFYKLLLPFLQERFLRRNGWWLKITGWLRRKS